MPDQQAASRRLIDPVGAIAPMSNTLTQQKSSRAASPRTKNIEVRRAPRALTLWNAVMTFLSAECRQGVHALDDREILNAWKFAAVADVMMRRSIQPSDYNHRRHHHIVHQCADADLMQRIAAEVRRRQLDQRFCLWISLDR